MVFQSIKRTPFDLCIFSPVNLHTSHIHTSYIFRFTLRLTSHVCYSHTVTLPIHKFLWRVDPSEDTSLLTHLAELFTPFRLGSKGLDSEYS